MVIKIFNMAYEQKKGWFERNYEYMRNTMAPIDPSDTKRQKWWKDLGFHTFMGLLSILLLCASLGIIFAASFAH